MHDIISYVPPLRVCWTFRLYQVSGCTFMFSHYWLIPYCEDVIVPCPAFRNVCIDEHPIVECLVILALASHLALLLFRKLPALNLFLTGRAVAILLLTTSCFLSQVCIALTLHWFWLYLFRWPSLQVSRCMAQDQSSLEGGAFTSLNAFLNIDSRSRIPGPQYHTRTHRLATQSVYSTWPIQLRVCRASGQFVYTLISLLGYRYVGTYRGATMLWDRRPSCAWRDNTHTHFTEKATWVIVLSMSYQLITTASIKISDTLIMSPNDWSIGLAGWNYYLLQCEVLPKITKPRTSWPWYYLQSSVHRSLWKMKRWLSCVQYNRLNHPHTLGPQSNMGRLPLALAASPIRRAAIILICCFIIASLTSPTNNYVHIVDAWPRSRGKYMFQYTNNDNNGNNDYYSGGVSGGGGRGKHPAARHYEQQERRRRTYHANEQHNGNGNGHSPNFDMYDINDEYDNGNDNNDVDGSSSSQSFYERNNLKPPPLISRAERHSNRYSNSKGNNERRREQQSDSDADAESTTTTTQSASQTESLSELDEIISRKL